MLPKPGRGNRVTTTNKTHRMQQPKTHGKDSLPTDPHVACVCQHNACHATQASATSPKHHVRSQRVHVHVCKRAHVACRGTSYHAVCVMYMHIAVHIRTHVLRSQQIAISTVNIRAHDRSSVAVDRSGLSVSSTGIRVTSRHAEQHLHHHADQYLHLSSASTCAGRHSAPVLIIWVKIVLKITSPMEP